MKNLKYLFIFLFVLSCGYTPIYQTDQKLNIKIDTISLLGDKNISRKIVINSTKREDVVTKDKKGNATSYKLTLEVDINLSNNSNNKNFKKKFSKDMFFNSKNSKFELDQYRLSLEKNMISQILQEINLYLRNLENDL